MVRRSEREVLASGAMLVTPRPKIDAPKIAICQGSELVRLSSATCVDYTTDVKIRIAKKWTKVGKTSGFAKRHGTKCEAPQSLDR
jgi:hypothetical protein